MYIFDAAAKLCDVMAIKDKLGQYARKAYENGDKAGLACLASNEYVQITKWTDTFARAFEKQWFKDKKPHGFDIQYQRLGGLLRRTDS